MIYKIKKDKRSGNFVVTRQQYYNDPFKFETQAKRVLQFDSAILVHSHYNRYALYLSASKKAVFTMGNISQYRVFRNKLSQNCILALKIHNNWVFLVPKSFQYNINSVKILQGRLETLPKLPVTDYDLPAYFKKGFEDTLEFIFHANGKDYLISPKSNLDMTGTAAQIEITEFTKITPLPPKCYFKAINEAGEHLFWNSCLRGAYPVLEEFDEKDYPEEFKSYHGYWGKDTDGNILGLHITDSNGGNWYIIKSEKPIKSIHFYRRIYTDTVNKYYYDIWQIIYINGQKQLKLVTHISSPSCPDIIIDEKAWNF